MSYMFTNTGEKPYKRSHCNKCGKYLQNRRIKDAPFCHFWKENCEFCEQMYSTPTSQTSPMLTHTGEKLYKRRSVIYVENIFLNHWPEDAQI